MPTKTYHIPFGQTWLENCMKGLGYRSSDAGLCHGTGYMGAQAMLCGESEIFNRRLELLSRHTPRSLAARMNELKRKRAKLAINARRKRYKKKALVVDAAFSEEEKILLTAPAFFEGIEFYFQPNEYPDYFDPSNRPRRQNANLSKELTISQKLKDQGGFQCINVFSGIYNEKELIDYLSGLLSSIYKKNFFTPFVMVLSSPIHTISLGYDIRHGWMLLDTNKLPIRYFRDETILAKAIKEAFSVNEFATFSTQILTLNKNIVQTQDVIDTWKSENTWQNIHKVSKGREFREDSSKNTWLHTAADSNDHEMVRKLLQTKCDVNAKNSNNNSALYYAVMSGQLRAVKELLNNDLIDSNDKNILLLAIRCGNYDIAKYILSLDRLDPAESNNFGMNALKYAAKAGHSELVELLLKDYRVKKTVNAMSKSGLTALHNAIHSKNIDCIKLLLAADIDPNLSGGDAKPPIHLAVSKGFAEIVHLLLLNPKINRLKVSQESSPLDIATENGYKEIIKLFQFKDEIESEHSINGKSTRYLAMKCVFKNEYANLLLAMDGFAKIDNIIDEAIRFFQIQAVGIRVKINKIINSAYERIIEQNSTTEEIIQYLNREIENIKKYQCDLKNKRSANVSELSVFSLNKSNKKLKVSDSNKRSSNSPAITQTKRIKIIP